MQLKQEDIKKILKEVPKEKRQAIENILVGNTTHYVRCGSCKRVIAEITKAGKILPVLDEEGRMWLLAHRDRFDGFLGFQCDCGNDSRLAEQEKAVGGLRQLVPSKMAMQEARKRVINSPSNYPQKNGKQNIDNFIIEEA